MKNIWKISILLCAAAGVMTACNDAEYSQAMEMHAYVSQTASGKAVAPITISADETVSTAITVCVNKPAKDTLRFRLVMDQATLDRYNKKESSDYVMLPSQMLDMYEEIKIAPGKYNSNPFQIGIKKKTADIPNDIYALGLRLESIDGLCAIAPSTGNYVLPTVSPNIYSLPLFRNVTPKLFADWTPVDYTEGFTVEFRYQVSTFGTGSAGYHVFQNRGAAPNNIGNLYLVHWDTPSPNPDNYPAASRLQVDHKNPGSVYYQPSSIGLRTNVWNHIAVTYDGITSRLYYNGNEVAQYELNIKTVFDDIQWFQAQWTNAKVLCTEMRVWSVARSASQIANNFTSVSPRAKNLEAYWTMTKDTYELDGSTHTWADRTGNGHTMRTNANFASWIDNINSSDASTAY